MQLVPTEYMLREQDGVTIIIWKEYSNHNNCLCCVGNFALLVWYTAINNGYLSCEMQYTKIDEPYTLLLHSIRAVHGLECFVYQTG